MAELLDLDVNGSTSVVYADEFGTEEFKLLEVDESILKELLHDGYILFYFLFNPSSSCSEIYQ